MLKFHSGMLAVSLLAAVGFSTPLYAAAAPRIDWKEVVDRDEAQQFAKLATEIVARQDAAARDAGMPVTRGFHAKSHTAVLGEFKIAADIPAAYRQGLFAQPGTFKTWFRLSSGQGQGQDDRKPDVRGFAVKLLNVPGPSLTGTGSFDVLCINFAAQPARDINQFMAFLRASGTFAMPVTLAATVGFGEATRMLSWFAAHLGQRVDSMATIDFYSAVPLAFGKFATKLRIQPRNPASGAVNVSDEDYLRHDLIDRLRKGPLRWDLLAQLYTDPVATPIEDASVEWGSPFVKIGEFTVSQRDLNSAASRSEEVEGNNLLWNPWNAPEEHRPLGSLMRARRVIYPASGTRRGAKMEGGK